MYMTANLSRDRSLQTANVHLLSGVICFLRGYYILRYLCFGTNTKYIEMNDLQNHNMGCNNSIPWTIVVQLFYIIGLLILL